MTRTADVVLAAELGAWALGFVFAPSPRRVTIEVARGLVNAAVRTPGRRATMEGGEGSELGGRPLTVGVFGDSPADAVVEVADAVGLDAVQLHGSRPSAAAMRKALGGREPRVLVIQVIPVPAADASTGVVRKAVAAVHEAVAAAREDADLLLFDTRAETRWGGTGRTFPWQVAREAAGSSPFLIAGGLGPHNLRAALEASGAWGVDVSSGVELAPGIKDEGLLRALFAPLGEVARALAAHRPPVDHQ